MGKVEKVIVLSVLFLIALILVVSLTVDAPLEKGKVVDAGALPPPSSTVPFVPAPTTSVPAATTAVPATTTPSDTLVANAAGRTEPTKSGLLSSNILAGDVPPTPTPVAPKEPVVTAPVSVATPALPPGALLKKLDGLTDSILPDIKLYTWKEGDSYKNIATTYYGNWQKMTVLKRSNEGRTDVQPGQTIFVPVFDTDATAIDRSKGPTAERLGGSAPAAASGRVHIVTEGESLWKIAKKELGNGDRWKEIYELNRDVLAKPEAVHKGQRLRLP